MNTKRKILVCSATILVAAFAPAASGASAKKSASIESLRARNRPCPALTSRQAYVGDSRATRHQARVISIMLQESTKLRASFRVQVAILSAGMQESQVRELPYGSGTSLGPLQLISIHGSASQRIRTDFSSRWFLPQAIRIDRPGLAVAELAVRVQRPADRRHYKYMIETRWKQSAIKNTRRYLRGCKR